ncbi:hypothetical protein LBMAG46_22060 [Planctomycetia bacterium]|nr:hypothetical protein LBMAG46_22060 [Planctomycetia bacterium]
MGARGTVLGLESPSYGRTRGTVLGLESPSYGGHEDTRDSAVTVCLL